MLLNPQILFPLIFLISLAASEDVNFAFNGFKSVNLTLDGIAKFTTNGLLALTNATKQQQGHAFFPTPIDFKNTSNGSVFSFSTTFVFAIIPQYPSLSGHGTAFVVAPTPGLPGTLPSQYLGLFNDSNNGNLTNHVLAVELDTIKSKEFNDINDNHVGIDINGLHSNVSKPAMYYDDKNNQNPQNLSLFSGKKMQVWVEYDGSEQNIKVTIAPINVEKPSKPLLVLNVDLSPIFNQTMYVGFSSSTDSVMTSHYILGWSFRLNGVAQVINLSQLPKLPRIGPKKTLTPLAIGLPLIIMTSLLIVISGVLYYVKT